MFVAALTLFIAIVADAKGQQLSPMSLLASRYDKGEHESVATALQQTLQKPANPKETDAEVVRAIRPLGAEVGAAFCLEVAIAVFESDEALSQEVLRRGMTKLRGSSDAFALAWYRAVVAFAQGPPRADSVPVLSQNMAGGFGEDVTLRRGDDFPKDRSFGLIVEASRRFPQDLEIRFALSLHDAMSLHNFLNTRNLVLQSPQLPAPSPGTGWSFRKPDFKRLAAPLQELTRMGTPEQRGRAMLYLGYFQYYDGAIDEAIGSWAQARSLSPDRGVQYLALVFQARALWGRKGGLTDALAFLAEATTLCPGAQTASRMLASLLFILGDTHGASNIVNEMLTTTPTADPWSTFLRGDHDKLSARLELMRKAL